MIHKFRAWDKENKCYIPEWQDATRLIEKHGFNGGDRFIVEVQSGIKDKSGVNFHHQDIIKDDNGCVGFIAIGTFGIDAEGFNAEDYYYYGHEPFSYPWAEFEIIGTVNENPELLEVDNE